MRPLSRMWRRGDSYCLVPDELVGGNAVRLLCDHHALDAMRQAIAASRSVVVMNSYIFADDATGHRMARELAHAARRGVSVWLCVDAVGAWGAPAHFFDTLAQDGVRILLYHPVTPWRQGFNLWLRNHRKILVVDGHTGFIGGVNVARQWDSPEAGGEGWHDVHVEVRGPVVERLAHEAAYPWRRYRRETPPHVPPPPPQGAAPCRVVASSHSRGRRAIRRAYLHAIKRARRYVYIANAYFIPDAGVRRALRNAARRNVDVRIMVPARSDVAVAQLAGQYTYAALLRAGIRLFAWQPTVLHAKTAVIDDRWATVGSCNMDRRSFSMNLEANLDVLDETFAVELRRRFEQDLSHCTEITIDSWRRRPLILRFAQWFCHLFRKLL